AAASDTHFCSIFVEIADHFAGFSVSHNSSERNQDFQIFSGAACTIASFAMHSASRFKRALVTEIEQCVFPRCCNDVDVATLAAVTAIRAASRNKFLAAEADTSPAA